MLRNNSCSVLVCAVLLARTSEAQDQVFDAEGLQPRRDYLSYSSTERVDR